MHPVRGDAACCDVVTGHVDREPTDVADGADDRIYVGDEDVVADSRQRDVFAKCGTQDDVSVLSLHEGEDVALEDIE